MALGLWDFLLICVVCVLTALLVLPVLWRQLDKRSSGQGDAGALRLANGRVVECDASLQVQLDGDGWTGDLRDLRPYFSFRFSGLPVTFPVYHADGSWSFQPHSPSDPAVLLVVRKGGVLSIVLDDPGSTQTMADHVTAFRAYVHRMAKWISDATPHPNWMLDPDGKVIWSNLAYKALKRHAAEPAAEDLPVLRCGQEDAPYTERHQNRVRFRTRDDLPDRWYDVTVSPRRGLTLYLATDVTAVVKAEKAQRSFVQTLTKTFAQLSTGLAIFDRNRRLALFNPALIDLTSLSPEFLSARPDHQSFFDKLRDETIMPEPRNYSNWRDQIMDLISRAESGQYEETWNLAQGKTYRVTGRPHPNGAVAFLFEDISAEVTLTRRFREQLDIAQAVMESLDDAIAVFSPQGVLSYTNPAYQDLWGISGGATQLDQKVADVSAHWQKVCGPDPTWGDFRDFVVGFGDRCEWDARVRMSDGRQMDCRFKPLQGGATLATFRILQTRVPQQEISSYS